MAPEQLAGERVTAAADVYALATVAFEALTGRRARTGDSPMAIVHQVANEPAPELKDAWPEAPPAASGVLLRGMADSPAERPESGVRMVADLRRALGPVLDAGGEQPAPAPPAPEPRTPAPEPRTPAPEPRTPAPEPAAAPASAPTPGASKRSRRPLRALLALVATLALVAVVLVVALSGGSDEPPPSRPAAPAPARSVSPSSVVRDFYREAAADRFAEAWKLAGPSAREQLGGFDAFKRQLGTLRSIEFRENRVTSRSGRRATVAISTRAVHTNRVDNCRGDVFLDRRGSGWLIGRLGVSCG
jgi:hypothetical protein